MAILKGQHGHRGQDCRSQLHLDNMFTYEESVLSFADEAGNLTHADASKLLADHGQTMEDFYADNHGVSWLHLDARNAEALLAWLGY